ncbi:MAG TPA: hypothetical protein DIU48_10475 [Acidobacteria bacterium]|jgi:hypothetical protein|uniref:DUF6644 domain-containing protein n=1 Tax=marine metagenome TaxID=408172 RepID=A0A381STR7_9ZZZZ|nr:hypothetical protein [Acidobacteriota bacterium]|tara:strand:- start:426 stop:959 length:534 start_codon:yes stop_codon:yes gene_type:complete
MIPAMKESVAAWLAESQARELAVYLLGNVPGLPPIAQSFHILGIAVVMSSAVMINLRLLGLAVPSQNVSEMIGRLMPWTWWALLVNATTGLLFVVARPNRYFYNPVFSWKFFCLVPAVLLALVIYRMSKREPGYWEQSTRRLVSARVIASISLILWVGVVLAGRWIAYSDYLYFLYE